MHFDRLKRRKFIALLGGAAALPLAARAQPTLPIIGWISVIGVPEYIARAFRQGLGEMGYIDGRNVLVEFQSADGQYDRLPALAADLVRRQVSLIATSGNAAVLAAKASTRTIPIVFTTASDPVALVFVASLNRPGGNVTGSTFLNEEIGRKKLELMHELVPTANVMGLLVNPTNPTVAEPTMRGLQAAARILGLQVHVLQASTERDFDAVFAALGQLQAGALVIGTDAFFNSRSDQLAGLTLRHAMPTIFEFRQFVVSGGLASYGGNLADSYRLAGLYAGRILKGEKPADLPVQQATKVELVVNLKTAKALGLSMPLTLLARADEAIE
jgi:putative ABC transport system substrate-binding protein